MIVIFPRNHGVKNAIFRVLRISIKDFFQLWKNLCNLPFLVMFTWRSSCCNLTRSREVGLHKVPLVFWYNQSRAEIWSTDRNKRYCYCSINVSLLVLFTIFFHFKLPFPEKNSREKKWGPKFEYTTWLKRRYLEAHCIEEQTYYNHNRGRRSKKVMRSSNPNVKREWYKR